MSLLSIHALLSHARPVAAAETASPADAHGFEAMLGRLSEPAASLADATKASDARAKDLGAKAANGQTSAARDDTALSALQSLEAALSSLARPAASTSPAVAPRMDPAAQSRDATPLGAALHQAADALGEAAASGRLSIKGMLQADPALRVTDIQMRTFLGVSGATPARAGAAPLSRDAAWSPAEIVAAAAAPVALSSACDPPALSPAAISASSLTQPTFAAPVAKPTLAATRSPAAAVAPAAVVAPFPSAAAEAHVSSPVAPARRSGEDNRTGAPASLHAVSGAVDSSASSGAFGSTGARGAEGGVNNDARGGSAATSAVDAASGISAASAPATVALADLPAFLAGEASSLTSAAATEAPSASSSPTTPAAARTAQAVKELKISLDPADLGEMTIKLRLADGKLSVSIAVANPSTLGTIQDDRELIAARLAGGGQTLENLVISRQALATQGVSQTDGSDESGGASTDEGGSDPDMPQRPPARPGAGGGGFGALRV